MLLLIHAICLVLAITQCFCYVFDVKYSYTYSVNTTGYLTTFLQTDVDGFRVVAGIPKEDKILICNNKSPSCQAFSPKEKNPAGYELLGAVIDGGINPDDPIYICSPRFVVLPQYRVNGRCFAFENGSFTQINSINTSYLQIQIFNSTPEFYYAHGQAGFSIKYINGTEFVLGAPGVLSWKGTIVKHTDHKDKEVVNPEKIIEKNSYLGYSVEYGNFYFAGKRIRCVITGAPRDVELIGQVYIFDYESDRNYPIKILRSDQMSSFYGSSLLVTSNNELLVGAPMYKTKAFEEGCVFVYSNNMQDFSLSNKICGNQMGSRFGTAMREIGFIGINKHLAIAISAPFADDGVGIVYIYVKIDEGYKEIQKIMGKSVSDTTRGFGFSLSNAVDVDRNNYNDISVSSLVTDAIVVLRSRKILQFTAYPASYVDKISTNTKNISLSYCFQYSGHAKDTDQVNTAIFVESDSRVAVINGNRSREVRIGENICEDIILVLTPVAFDSPLPLNVRITNKLAECNDCPVAYPKSTTVIHEIPFVTGCGEDNVCTPSLELDAYIEQISTLILGSQNTVTLTVSVSNKGETAYLTKMNVTLPTQINQFPAACAKVENMLHCDISNRLVLNETKQLQFLFDVKHLEAQLHELAIDVSVGSAGAGDGRFAMTTVRLPITLQSSITFIGSKLEYVEDKEIVNFTHEYTVFNNGPSPLIGQRFSFRIPEGILTRNGGVIYPFIINPLADECIPVDEGAVRKRRHASSLEHILPDVPHSLKYNIDCKSNDFVICKTYYCIIGELGAGGSLKFKFKLELKTSLLFEALGSEIEGKSIFPIQSVASVFNHSDVEKTFSHTVLTRMQLGIPNMWIWMLVAVGGSLIILSIIICILYKLNFFARPMREKLLTEEEQKHERECIIVSDDKNDESDAGVFNGIQF